MCSANGPLQPLFNLLQFCCNQGTQVWAIGSKAKKNFRKKLFIEKKIHTTCLTCWKRARQNSLCWADGYPYSCFFASGVKYQNGPQRDYFDCSAWPLPSSFMALSPEHQEEASMWGAIYWVQGGSEGSEPFLGFAQSKSHEDKSS